MPAAAADLAAVLAFETATFPSWTRWFRAGHRNILLARDGAGTLVATLLFDGPGADTVSGRCSDRQPPSSDASGSHPIWKDAASAPPW